MAGRISELLTLGQAPSDEELNPFAIPLGPSAQRATGRRTMAAKKGDQPRKIAKPTIGDYASTLGHMALAVPRISQTGYDLGASIAKALPDALSRFSVGDVLPAAVQGIRNYADYASNDKANALADFSVVGAGRDFLHDFQRAAELRASGQYGSAADIEKLALPFLAMGVLPGGGKARAAERAGREGLEEAASLAAREVPSLAALSDIRAPRENLQQVLNANTEMGRIRGERLRPISEISGGPSLSADDRRRVETLKTAMASPSGYVERLIVDDAGNLIEGAHRLEALRQLGATHVPVVEIQDFSRDFPAQEIKAAVSGAQDLHPDHVNQIASHLAEAFADEGGDVSRIVEDYDPPKGYESAWQAGLDALQKSREPAPLAVQSVPASPRAEASLAAREGEQVAKPTHTFVRTEVPEVAPLPGKGGKSRRKTTAAQVRDEAAARARAEAQARLAVTDPVERRAIRDEYTIGPLAVDPDPALQRFSLRPGSQQSVTSQAMELGVPVEGATPFFTQHPAGYSTSWGSAAPTPMTVTGTYRNRTPEPDVPMLNEGDIPIGAGLFRALGDATMANKDVLSVNGVNLVNPVSTLGGARYGYQEAAVGNPLVWASDASVEENDARMIRDWQNENPGMPVIGMHVNMGSSGSDFSHQTGNILANLIPNLGLSGDKLRLIDDYIRSGKEGLADFAGFAEDPALGLFDILTRPGGDRKLVTKRLSDVTKEAQMAGVPGHLGALARLAVAEPGLRLAPQGSTGFSVFQIDPENFLRVDPSLLSGAKRRLFEGTNEYANVLGEPVKFMRPDYNAGFSGRNLGQMQSLIPAEIPFGPVFARAKEITKTGAPTTTTMKFKSFATDPNSIVTYTPEIQDALGQYLHDVSKYKRLGWSRGGLAELADKYAA